MVSRATDGVLPNQVHLVCVTEGCVLPVSKAFDWYVCHCWYGLLTDVKMVLRQLPLMTDMLLNLLGFIFNWT